MASQMRIDDGFVRHADFGGGSEAVFSIDPDSVGPDGFGAVFFHTCWEIIAEDVFAQPMIGSVGSSSIKSCSERVSHNAGLAWWLMLFHTAGFRLVNAHPTMFYQAPGLIRVSHLAYADDLMIFTTTCRQNMELLRDFLRAYERVSGQLINGSKSSFIVGRQASSLQTQAVQDVLGYQLKHLPITYLGVPLYKGNRKACLFDPIISRLRDLLQGWAMTNLPWREVGLDSKCVAGHSIASASGMFSVAEGGLGVRSLADYVRAFSMKLWWRFRGKSSLWSEFCIFLADNWFGEKPLAQLVHRDTYTMESVRYYWHEGDWNVPRILRIIPMPFAQTICQIPIAAGQGDRIVWTESSTGISHEICMGSYSTSFTSAAATC
ncbi:UNVERIFIED_CONTAM: hypothetical protein Scaly_2887800 [Sesamum calycinum]|uniref:Reverse transcriptase domain-containing protein n=1 Tax=Sesamum calycinum TaxID=2727403 RepID=A0AAW2L6W9_9LAMI